jgi:hypothetical protein
MIEEVKNEGVFATSLDEHDLMSLASVVKCLNDANNTEETMMFFHGEIKITEHRDEGGVSCYGTIESNDGFWMFKPSVLRDCDAVKTVDDAESDGAK